MSIPTRDVAGLAYLEARQKDAALTFCVDVSPKGDDAYLELASDLIMRGAYPPETDQASLARTLRHSDEIPDPSRWSTYERPDHRLRLWRAERAVIRGMKALGKVLPSPLPALGTLPTWRLNAEAIPVPLTGGYIIAFDSGLFAFTAGWGDVLAACLTPVNDGGLLDRFVDLCFCQVILGTSAYLDRRPAVNPAIDKGGELFDVVFEAFLLGHEYAHVTLGHQTVDLNLTSGSDEDQGFTHEDELEADALGFRVVLEAFSDPVLAYLSVAAFFSALLLMERGYGLLEGEKSALPRGDSHPPAAERRASLFSLASKLIPGEALKQAVSLVAAIEERTIQMWEPLERGFRDGLKDMPHGWAPGTPEEKSSALFAFKWFCLGPPASLR